MHQIKKQASIKHYEDVIRGVINYSASRIDLDKLALNQMSFREKVKDLFRLDTLDGSTYINSCLDCIGDTELAISDFYLEDFRNTGIRYLILYGVLSAIYIQRNSILKLCEIFKVENKTTITSKFNELGIFFLRNAVAAHPTNFNDGKINGSFKVARYSIENFEKIVIVNNQNEFKNYNVFYEIEKYKKYAEEVMNEVAKKVILIRFKSSKEKRDEFLKMLTEL